MQSSDLKKAGLKATLPRIKILGMLESAEQQHMSAEDIYRALLDSNEEVGLATVYRVLTQFEAAGLVIRHHFETGQAVFELNRGEHHDHLVCVKCNLVVEFCDELVENQQRKIAKQHGFSLTDHSMILYGICDRCHRA